MTTDPNSSPEPTQQPARTPAVTAVLWTAKVMAASILFYAGYHKLTGSPADRELFDLLGMEPQGRYVIGSLESVAAILILIPQGAVYGAFLGLGIMCGAIIGHLTQIGLGHIQWALLVAALCATVLYIRRRDAPFIRNLWDH
jgi:uncharacterized membrane protein YphA (DoxX/SURF4 family)